MISKRLSRQLRRQFKDEKFIDRVSAFAGKGPPFTDDENLAIQSLLEGFPAFCLTVDGSYEEGDRLLEVAQRNLEVSSGELHQLNTSLLRLNQTFDVMVNSLGQGFLLFGRDGICSPVYSRACLDLLEVEPPGVNIAEVLRVAAEGVEDFRDWYTMLMEERIEFDELAALGPKRFKHSKSREVELEFKPVRDNDGKIQMILLIATDRTHEIESQMLAEKNQNFANMVIAILKDKENFQRYLQAAQTLILELRELIKESVAFSEDILSRLQNRIHTLKGITGTIFALKMQKAIHAAEKQVLEIHEPQGKYAILKRTVSEIELEFDNLVNQLQDLLGGVGGQKREVEVSRLQEFRDLLQAGTASSAALLAAFEARILATPIEDILASYNEILRQTAAKLNKLVAPIEVGGDALSVRRETLGPVWTSLNNVFRNIVDHGIESPQTRLGLGKPEAGRVRVAIKRLENSARSEFEMRIADDGAGINVEALRRVLHEQGRSTLAQSTDRNLLINSIFEMGVSTSSREVNLISGMGIGLNSVKEAVHSCGGTVRVESEPNSGTTFVLTLPIALAKGH